MFSALLAILVLLCAPAEAMATYKSMQIVSDEFAGNPVGPLLIYTPFDGAQGVLTHAHVMVFRGCSNSRP